MFKLGITYTDHFEAMFCPCLNQPGAIAASNWPAAKMGKSYTQSLSVSLAPVANTTHQRQHPTRQDEPPGTTNARLASWAADAMRKPHNAGAIKTARR